MENNIKLTVNSEKNEVIVLTGTAEAVYHEKAINVSDASINSVHEYLSKKDVEETEILNSKLEFSYDKLFINLYFNARSRQNDVVLGKLKLHPDLEKFSINSSKTYSTFELADFIKMNRHYFENKDIAMKLVSELRSFEGKVNSEIEKKADTRGNQKQLIHQTVESNIPSGFILVLPIFIGQEKLRLEVEINITADFSCSLISPDLKQLIDLETKVILDEQLEKIKELHPQLRVYEL